MAANLNVALERLQEIGRDAIAALPNVLIALVVLLVFWLIDQATRGLVDRVWGHREGNLGRLFGRLAPGAVWCWAC
ncbi:mechanosensitive ion channel family protein [Deinococcus apachensis]|uniref:mechanosensitive ion channel family protein n=1 Tax=Deinococcus apachensis TaxID=309886 RepID=UPI0003A1FC43|nr:hypothetical protein [Deinococcus apachensis]